MVKIKAIRKKHYKGKIYDLNIENTNSPYFYANEILTHNSLYPNIMIQCNLYNRKPNVADDSRPIWSNDKWQMIGEYYTDEEAPVGKLLKKWYEQRLEFKSNGDRREYSLKIFLNIIYGILNNPYYVRVYDSVAGADCTAISRAWIRFARKKFHENGYIVLYTDTDSCFVQDTYKDENRLMRTKNDIIKLIKEQVPFPYDKFDMKIDARIKYIYFFEGQTVGRDTFDRDNIPQNNSLMKKNYIYVTTDGDVVIKNLGIKKKSNSALSKKIFWDYLVPKIKTGQIQFSRVMITQHISDLLEKDITLASYRKEVTDIEHYANRTSLVSQISMKYGSGIHFLIPNKRKIGVGKGKSYCTVEEFKKNNLRVRDIDLDNVYKELEYFIRKPFTKNLFEYIEGTKNE